MSGNDRYLGRILDNRYEILELIGVGGMAYVYKALCHRLNRLVAIKILKEDLANDEEFQRRFYTESQAVAMLSHPNIVAVYDVSRSGNTEYIVMELIEGITLKQYINRKGLLNWKEVLHFTTQIVKALNHAHSRGIIHRDIKPHNIMILKDGSVKVADFGIARLLAVQNTLTQEALGSVHYISPEQAKGGQIDERSDIYSVGVVMYEMLTSRLPFIGDSAVAVAIQHISAIPLSPRDINPDIPIGLEEITMHAMQPDIHTRFATAEEMLNDLEEFRKYPGIVFNYAMSNPADRLGPDLSAPYETRNIPRPDARPTRPSQPYTGPAAKAEMSSDEFRSAKKRSSSTATLVGIFAVVVFLVVLVAVFILPILNNYLNPTIERVNVPDFIGQGGRTFEDITRNPEWEETFRFEKREEANNDIPEGIAFRQDPPANAQRSRPMSQTDDRIPITIFVSSGNEPPREMPDFIGMHHTMAENELNRMGLNLVITSEEIPGENEEVPRGNVVETIPPAGSPISRNDRVVLRYSRGVDTGPVVVPNLVGSRFEDVEREFRRLDLIAVAQHMPDASPVGTVFQIPRAGETAQRNTTVNVFVSTGPPPSPEPSPSPEPPSPSPEPPSPSPEPPSPPPEQPSPPPESEAPPPA